MPRVPMEVGNSDDGVPRITFEPRGGADFRRISMVIPDLSERPPTIEDFFAPDRSDEIPSREYQFRIDVKEEVQRSCGNIACEGDVSFGSCNQITDPAKRIIVSSTIVCSTVGCPLEPPDSGDGALLPPRPPLPSLKAELPVPVELFS